MADPGESGPPGAPGSTQGPPAGWYDDPQASGQRRYWDGSRWTEHRAPGATAGRAAPPVLRRPGQANRPWYRSPGILISIGASLLVVVVGGVLLANVLSTANRRSDAESALSGFEHSLASAHNAAIADGEALVQCWNTNVSPEEAAAACRPSCNACSRTAREEAHRLRVAYRNSPKYVQRVYAELYRVEMRHLAALVALGALTRHALNVVAQGDATVFYRYQGEALDQNSHVQRIEAQVGRAVRRARARRRHYVEGL